MSEKNTEMVTKILTNYFNGPEHQAVVDAKISPYETLELNGNATENQVFHTASGKRITSNKPSF